MPGVEEARANWDARAQDFARYVEPFSVNIAQSLLMMLDLPHANALLEVGAGAGAAATLARKQLPPGAGLVVTDLSPAMVALARARNPDTEVLEADAALLPFQDSSFDRLLSNLNLMLVDDPDLALAEAFRVLKPGGLAAWSVWGRPAHSPLMRLPEAAMKKCRIEFPKQARSNFHLGKRKKLLKLLKQTGFSHIQLWRQSMVMPFADGEDFAVSTLTSMYRLAQFLGGLPRKKQHGYLKKLAKLADKVLKKHRPIGLELLMVVAQRPPEPLQESVEEGGQLDGLAEERGEE